jgi:hypothetical protein
MKSSRIWIGLAGCAGILLASVVDAQQYIATVAYLEPPASNQGCVWFTLAGVPQADPALPNSPWFAIPTSQLGYSELYAALLSAKVAGNQVQVVTTGAVAGGSCSAYAGVAAVILQ